MILELRTRPPQLTKMLHLMFPLFVWTPETLPLTVAIDSTLTFSHILTPVTKGPSHEAKPLQTPRAAIQPGHEFLGSAVNTATIGCKSAGTLNTIWATS